MPRKKFKKNKQNTLYNKSNSSEKSSSTIANGSSLNSSWMPNVSLLLQIVTALNLPTLVKSVENHIEHYGTIGARQVLIKHKDAFFNDYVLDLSKYCGLTLHYPLPNFSFYNEPYKLFCKHLNQRVSEILFYKDSILKGDQNFRHCAKDRLQKFCAAYNAQHFDNARSTIPETRSYNFAGLPTPDATQSKLTWEFLLTASTTTIMIVVLSYYIYKRFQQGSDVNTTRHNTSSDSNNDILEENEEKYYSTRSLNQYSSTEEEKTSSYSNSFWYRSNEKPTETSQNYNRNSSPINSRFLDKKSTDDSISYDDSSSSPDLVSSSGSW